MNSPNTETLLTQDELAQRWGCSTRWLRDEYSAGRGPQAVAIFTRGLRYRLQDVIAYEDRNLTGGVPTAAKASMLRAAEMFDIIARWKLSDQTLATIVSISTELRERAK